MRSEIVELVYKRTKDTDEHPSETLRHLADQMKGKKCQTLSTP
jgi:hypothetical protein